ncbi:MAG TPA: 30S ribosomal protein S16 [Candidatus Paceibacterota bacterium]|nr:30S ribosomal protein S16 [Candidatus Paceibacterota bacterium]
MLVIRLNRIGKKHQPSYRLVVSERRSKLGGPPAEDLGFYNPFTKATGFKQERVRYWLGVGAKPTVTVHNLLVKQGVLGGEKIKLSIKKAEDKAEETLPAGSQATEVAAAAEPTATEAPVVEPTAN